MNRLIEVGGVLVPKPNISFEKLIDLERDPLNVVPLVYGKRTKKADAGSVR